MNIEAIGIKEDSEEKLLQVQDIDPKFVLFAPEFNAVVYEAKTKNVVKVGKWNRTAVSEPAPDDPEIGEFIKGFFAPGHYIEGFVLDTDLSVIENIDIRVEHKTE